MKQFPSTFQCNTTQLFKKRASIAEQKFLCTTTKSSKKITIRVNSITRKSVNFPQSLQKSEEEQYLQFWQQCHKKYLLTLCRKFFSAKVCQTESYDFCVSAHTRPPTQIVITFKIWVIYGTT